MLGNNKVSSGEYALSDFSAPGALKDFFESLPIAKSQNFDWPEHQCFTRCAMLAI